MELDRIANQPEPVDEVEVQAQILAWLNDQDRPEPRERWRITSLGAADWAMRIVGEVHARCAEYDEQIRAWQKARDRVAAAGAWLEERLEEWGIEQRTDRLKSVQVAHGSVATRKAAARVVVVDEDAAIAWAKAHAPDAVHVTERFNKSEVGAAWRIVEGGFKLTDTVTGEVRFAESVTEWTGENEAVESLELPVVIDRDGLLVPGVKVEPERITATVRASW